MRGRRLSQPVLQRTETGARKNIPLPSPELFKNMENIFSHFSAHLSVTLRSRALRKDGPCGLEAGTGAQLWSLELHQGVPLRAPMNGRLSSMPVGPHWQVIQAPEHHGGHYSCPPGIVPLSQGPSSPLPVPLQVPTHCPDPSLHQAAQPASVWAREEEDSHTRVTH